MGRAACSLLPGLRTRADGSRGSSEHAAIGSTGLGCCASSARVQQSIVRWGGGGARQVQSRQRSLRA